MLGHWPLSALALTVGEGDSDLVTSDVESFRQQELFFALLNLPQIGALLALQAISKFVRGRPSASVIWILAIGLLLESIHLCGSTKGGPHYRFGSRESPRSGRSGSTLRSPSFSPS